MVKNINTFQSPNEWNLKEKIEQEYGISQNDIQKFTSWDTLKNLEQFKIEMQMLNNEKIKTLSEKQIWLLFKTLSQIQQSESKIERASLIHEVERGMSSQSPKRNIEKYFSKNLVEKAENPQKPHEHILGFTLWAWHSILSIWESLFALWTWIIQTPYHLSLLLSWKAKTESFRNI